MKWRSLRYDKDVKPIWKNGMEILWWPFIIVLGGRMMFSEYNKHNNGKFDSTLEIGNWINLLVMLLFIVPGIVYLIKSSLFKGKSK